MSAATIESNSGNWGEKARHGTSVLGGLAIGAYVAAETASLLTGIGAGVVGHFVIKRMINQE